MVLHALACNEHACRIHAIIDQLAKMLCPILQICTWTSLSQSVHAANWTGSSNCYIALQSDRMSGCPVCKSIHCAWTASGVHSVSQSVCLSVWSKQQEQPCSCATGACINRTWAARYNTWFLSKLTLKGIVFSFLFCIDRPVCQWCQ